MIYGDLYSEEGMYIEGSTVEVAAECVFLMAEIYTRLVQECGLEKARGIMFDMMKQAIYDKKTREDIVWGTSLKEKLNYTE